MVKSFKEHFGLPTDRVKLEAEIGDFEIVQIEFRETKRKFNTVSEDDRMLKTVLPIAYIDARFRKSPEEIKKYFSMSKPIINASLDIVKDAGLIERTVDKVSKDICNRVFKLKEPVYIAKVESGASENNPNNPYLFFT